jgi:class 3 adenylate cyclase
MPQARHFEMIREIALPREEAWELLAHTEHLNRAVGLPPVQFGPLQENALHREATARLAGQTLRYREYPFQWIKYEEYYVRRVYEAGPLREFVGGIRFHPGAEPDSTRLEFFADVTPSNALGAALVPVVANRSLRQSSQYCSRYLELRRDAPVVSLPTPAKPPQIQQAAFDLALQQLKRQATNARSGGLSRRIVDELAEYLRTRGDNEVAMLRPFALAREWDASPDETLRVCLYATKAGLLSLSWNLMCPNCRVSKAELDSLAEVSSSFHCDLCGVEYTANFDQFVELRFRVHPGIRDAVSGTYCIGGPYVSPHVLVQKTLAPSEAVLFPMPDVADPLRLRVLRANQVVALANQADLAGKAPIRSTLEYSEDGWKHEQAVRPVAGETVSIINRSERDIAIVLEKTSWDDLAVTAAKVTTMGEFRDLFGSEVLAPGQHVSVENLTLFFSDLRDSTALYERSGDAPAYGCVRNHFDYLARHIEANHGSVVKTIGDAVMAVFYTPENAARAALAMQQQLDEFNATLPPERAVIIKIGLHSGPAIAVNSNERLDYFGRTVNLAARIQGASLGHDVVMSKTVFERPGVQQILQEYPHRLRKFDANLKGLEGVFTLYQVQL